MSDGGGVTGCPTDMRLAGRRHATRFCQVDKETAIVAWVMIDDGGQVAIGSCRWSRERDSFSRVVKSLWHFHG
jgi:hypothetical protein